MLKAFRKTADLQRGEKRYSLRAVRFVRKSVWQPCQPAWKGDFRALDFQIQPRFHHHKDRHCLWWVLSTFPFGFFPSCRRQYGISSRGLYRNSTGIYSQLHWPAGSFWSYFSLCLSFPTCKREIMWIRSSLWSAWPNLERIQASVSREFWCLNTEFELQDLLMTWMFCASIKLAIYAILKHKSLYVKQFWLKIYVQQLQGLKVQLFKSLIASEVLCQCW